MRILTPYDVRVRLPWLVQVVRVAALAAEQCGVFGALHRLADSVHGQDYCKAFARFDHRFSYYVSHGEPPPDPTPGEFAE